MILEREVEIFKRTKECMDEIGGYGVENLGKLDEEFIFKFKNNMFDLRNMGFIHISDMMMKFLESGDIKDFIKIEFLLKSMENQLYKLLIK